ncbi:DUF4184 family protein [Motilibacter aurantiacus]|uniref:DUF4184 family protein n=1 Tax=Motilibacter aurantiacus TaxID=2714955 RepID=UPI00140C361A|nr:DUF4184 family protein [Motilibacter aurantiacus]
MPFTLSHAAAVLPLARRLRPLRRTGGVLGCPAAGAATHVLWDELTHAGHWGTAHLGVLARE